MENEQKPKPNGGAERTDTPSRIIGLAVYFAPDDPKMPVWWQLTDGGGQSEVTIATVMMILREALQQVEDQRRAANAQLVAQKIRDDAAAEQIKRELARGMHS
jgi:hypothetical protein